MDGPEEGDKLNLLYGMIHTKELPNTSDILHRHWKQFSPLSAPWHIVIGIFTLIIGIGAFVGNLSIIMLFVRYKTFRSSANFLVLNLAISDFALVITNFPLLTISSFFGYWVGGSIGCRLYGFFGALSSFLSVNTLTAIALERCFVIVFGMPWFRKVSSKTIWLIIGFVWIYSFSWSVPPLLGWGDYILEGSLTSCTFDFFTRTVNNRSFVISIMISCFSVQVLLVVISYISIVTKVIRHEKKFKSMTESTFCLRYTKQRKNQKCEIKTAKIALCIITLFCGSWFPYAVISIVALFGRAELIFPLVSTIPGLCAKIATVINPFVYALLHPKFKCMLMRMCGINGSPDHFLQLNTKTQDRTLVLMLKGSESVDEICGKKSSPDRSLVLTLKGSESVDEICGKKSPEHSTSTVTVKCSKTTFF